MFLQHKTMTTYCQITEKKLSFTNSKIETRYNFLGNYVILPMMMSSMQPITASKAASAAEELEKENQEIKIISLKGRLSMQDITISHLWINSAFSSCRLESQK